MPIPCVQTVVDLSQSHLQVANVGWWIGWKVDRGSVLHELRMERAADADDREPVLVNKFSQPQFVAGQTMGAKTGNNIYYRRMARLQPEREIQFLPGGRD